MKRKSPPLHEGVIGLKFHCLHTARSRDSTLASRRGAPRKHGNDVHVAQQVLLTDVKIDRTWGVERAYRP